MAPAGEGPALEAEPAWPVTNGRRVVFLLDASSRLERRLLEDWIVRQRPEPADAGPGEAIRIPPSRPNIDWECELGVVIGREADHVPLARAADYIFGYTLQNDVSDRGGRGDQRFGSDWLLMKNRATFAPLGPFITPKEFIPDARNMRVRFTLNGQVMQDSNTSYMIHDVFEQIVYGSNILPLRPGDVIATGSPAGVGSARNPPIFLKNGDRTECTYDGVGVLRNPVVGPSAAATR